MSRNAKRGLLESGPSSKTDAVVADAIVPHASDIPQQGLPDRVGADVIVPLPWCSCGGALGIAPGVVVGFEGIAPVVDIDLSSCSTRPTPPHCTLPPLVYSQQEIEELRWVL